jgi:hypothetical protein
MSLELPSPDVLATLAVQIRISFKELTMAECAESALECWESCAGLLERTRRATEEERAAWAAFHAFSTPPNPANKAN